MPATPTEESTGSGPRPLFVTTRWTVVLSAQDRAAPGSAEALESLCRTYWYPLYAFVRGLGHSPPDAQDLTQEFFARLLARDYLKAVSPERGRFRTFLRMALKRFLSHEWERARAQKRGGGQSPLPFDTALAEGRFQADEALALPPDRLYDRRWALALLDEAVGRLRSEYGAGGKGEEFARLNPYLTAARGDIPYAELAATLGTTEGAARVAVHRLRRRFREVFRAMIADTVAGPEEVDEEMRQVLEALGS